MTNPYTDKARELAWTGPAAARQSAIATALHEAAEGVWQPVSTIGDAPPVLLDLWEFIPERGDAGFRLADCCEAVAGLWVDNRGGEINMKRITHWRIAVRPPKAGE